MTTEQTSAAHAVAPAADAALPALITLDPQQYTAAVYAPFRERLDSAKAAAAEVKYDIATTAGMKTACEWRARFRDLRVGAEKARKERKAPILEIGKLLDSRYKEFEAEIEPLETRFDADIKAEEARKEAERAERARIERERIEGLQRNIAEIRAYADRAAGQSSEHISDLVAVLLPLVIGAERFGEFAQQAETAKRETLERLCQLRDTAKAQEEEQARLKAEREELQRLRVEQAERERQEAARRAEEERQAKAAREAEETRLREERSRQEAELRAQREAQESELRRQREEQAAAERVAREAREAEEKRLADERAEVLRQQQELLRAQEALVEQKRAAEAPQPPEPVECEPAPPAAAERSNVISMPAPKPRESLPSDMQIIGALALHYRVHESKVVEWLLDMDLSAASQKIAANL